MTWSPRYMQARVTGQVMIVQNTEEYNTLPPWSKFVDAVQPARLVLGSSMRHVFSIWNQGKNTVAQLVRQLNVRTTFEQKKQSGIMTETCSIMAIKFAVDLVLHLDQLEESSLRTWSGQQLHWRHSLFCSSICIRLLEKTFELLPRELYLENSGNELDFMQTSFERYYSGVLLTRF